MALDGGRLHPFPRQKSPRNYSFWVLSSLLVVSYTFQRDHRDTLSSSEPPWKGRAMPVYQIRIKEQLGQHWSTWFGGLTIVSEANGETVLTGEVVDQAALHGLLSKVRDLQLTLLSVYPIEKDSPSRRGSWEQTEGES
jgi:hypothetical protein